MKQGQQGPQGHKGHQGTFSVPAVPVVPRVLFPRRSFLAAVLFLLAACPRRAPNELVADPQDPHRIFAATANGGWRLDERD